MIPLEIFTKAEIQLVKLAKLWNQAEADPLLYDGIIGANPHTLVNLIGGGTTYNDWQNFTSDPRIQEYIDKLIYAQAGRLITQLLSPDAHLSQADSARLNTAISYRDNHKADFAPPVQYIYMQVPLTPDEKAFLKPVEGQDKWTL